MKRSAETNRNLEPIVYIVQSDRSTHDYFAKLLARTDRTVTCFDSAEAFLDDHRVGAAGCLVLEIPLPGMDGLALQALLREREIGTPVIFVTDCADVSVATSAMRMGAYDLLEKPVDPATLRRRVAAAIEEDIEHCKHAAWRNDISGRIDQLSDGERAVLDQILDGRTTKQIAEELNIVRPMAEDQCNRIMAAMRVSSVAELVRLIFTYESEGSAEDRARALDVRRRRDQR